MSKFTKEKLKVLFVGAFAHTKDGAVGGQLHACKTLLRSNIKTEVDFVLVDSTMETLPPPRLHRRGYLATQRIIKFCYALLVNRIDTVFIFTSAGFSFIEKGLMVLIGHWLGRRVVLSPRSGLLIDDIENSRLMRWYVPFIMSRCDAVLCQSDSWLNFYQKLTQLPNSKFSVVKNWLDPQPYLGIPIVKSEHTTVNVLFLGWIETNKGIFELLSAVKKYEALQSNFKFVICGKGSQLDNAKSYVLKNNISHCFDFRGWVTGEDKISVLADSDILVMPSHREGLPNSLLEAMASGCSVIASSVGAIPDVITDEENGLLIERLNIDGLAKSLLYLLASPEVRYQIAMSARATVQDHHDISAVWINVHEILRSSASNSSSGPLGR